MKVEKTILPPAVLVSLYKDSLVLAEKEIKPIQIAENKLPGKEQQTIPEATEMASPIKYLGDHHKKILVVVNDPESVYLNETDFILLTSILNACKLTIADIALINLAKKNFSLHQILTQVPSDFVLVFDINPMQLKIKLPTKLYTPILLGETQLLFSNNLSLMQGIDQASKIEKTKLWSALKIIFKL